MPISPDFDHKPALPGIPAHGSLLSSDEQLTAGIRVTRAQFARMMGCSRQAVTEWVRAGRLTVGADGRFDPRKAVADLLRTGDPARLRAKVLQPLADELAGYRHRIVELEAALGQALQTVATQRAQLADAPSETLAFYEGANDELLEIFNTLSAQLPTVWHELAALPDGDGSYVVIDWLERALQVGVAGAGAILQRAVDGDEEGDPCLSR